MNSKKLYVQKNNNQSSQAFNGFLSHHAKHLNQESLWQAILDMLSSHEKQETATDYVQTTWTRETCKHFNCLSAATENMLIHKKT